MYISCICCHCCYNHCFYRYYHGDDNYIGCVNLLLILVIKIRQASFAKAVSLILMKKYSILSDLKL